MTTTDLTWDAPADGVWWLPLEHFPAPVSGLFAAAFPPVTRGWTSGALRYGMPTGVSRWATVNGWLYFSPGEPGYDSLDELEATAIGVLATRAWRDEVSRWFADERPRVVEANLALQAVDLDTLDDAALAAHFAATVAHFDEVAPLHFEHIGFDLAFGRLLASATGWGIGASELVLLLRGSSPASSEAVDHVDRIVAALRAAGTAPPSTLDDVRGASPDAAAALDDYLTHYGWRSLQGNEVASATLGERPDVVVASIRARMDAPPTLTPVSPDAVRSRVPESERARFDELLDDAKLTYQLRDDDGGVCFTWPLGLIRRAALEAGRRLATPHIFEATPDEVIAMLGSPAAGPTADELAERAELLSAAATANPPGQLGEWRPSDPPGLPPNVSTLVTARDASGAVGRKAAHTEALRGTGVGSGQYRGRACLISTPDTLAELEPGDVLVAVTTMSTQNSVFPIAGAVVTQEGGPFSHTAVLARELGLPAVVGVSGLLTHVKSGDMIEVDATAGTVRVIE